MDSLRASLAALLIALVAALIVVLPALDTLRGVSIDLLTAMRWRAFGNPYPPAASPTVVVALDEETFRTPPFEGTPSVTWTREIGQVLTAIIDGGAKVVGFDIIFPTSFEQSAVPFGGRWQRAHAPARSCSARSSTRTIRCCPRPASAPRSAKAATSVRSMSTAIPTT